ncbi:MAG: AAA family ATPase [Desulfotomaculaceae bacterium]|nr:AAA family ATPase [Desulfotomaculaceae bacterium]
MKANRIYLQNFRNHRLSDLGLGRVNIFLGRNNAGKSSVLAGLEWALTGCCSWTDRAGRGSGDLIKTGADSAMVLVDLDGAGQAVRTVNPNGLAFGGETTALAAQAKLYERLGTCEEDLRAALNVGAFLSMSPAAQKTYLFSVLGLRWDMDTVLEALDRWLEQGGEAGSRAGSSRGGLAERLRELVRPLYPPQVEAGPEVLDVIEKRLRELRRDTRRDLQQTQSRLAGGGTPDPAPGNNLSDVQARLAELRGQRAYRQTLSAIRDALAREDGRCPLGPQMACAMASADRTRLLAELDAGLQGNAGLNAQIAEAEALADRIKAHRQALAQAEALDRESRELAAALAEYELLVKAFGPDGIRRSALARSLGPFTARVNENLAVLTDGAYAVEFAPDLSPIVRHAGATVPARLLSTSEQLRIGIAIQEAIAAHLDLRFLAIDGADLLDQDNRDRLTGFVLERAAASEFDQVLVFSTAGDTPPNPGLPGLKMFWVEAGAVREI